MPVARALTPCREPGRASSSRKADRTHANSIQLKFDGKEMVSGTFVGLPEPGDVKRGTFNGESGTLMLALGTQKAEDVLLTLEGTVANGVATDRITGGMAHGEFSLAREN